MLRFPLSLSELTLLIHRLIIAEVHCGFSFSSTSQKPAVDNSPLAAVSDFEAKC